MDNGKVIKEENNDSSPSSPPGAGGGGGGSGGGGSTTPTIILPPGKENRVRNGSGTHSPLSLNLSNSEILTRSRTKVLTKDNHGYHKERDRMSEDSPLKSHSGKRTPSPQAVSVNLTIPRSSSSTPTCFSNSTIPHFATPHSSTPTSTNGRRSASPSILQVTVAGESGSLAGRTLNNTSSSSSSSFSSNPNTSSSTGMGGHIGGNSRLLIKIKRFLGTLLHFGHDINPEVGERVRALVFSLVSGHLSIEEFHHSLQEVTSFPLRPFVLPFLRAHLPLLQREIGHASRMTKQSTLAYIQTHEAAIMEGVGSSPGEPCDIFHSEASDLSLGKRKASESYYENGEVEGGGYSSTPKRPHHAAGAAIFSPPFFLQAPPTATPDIREYYAAAAAAAAGVGAYGALPLSLTTASNSGSASSSSTSAHGSDVSASTPSILVNGHHTPHQNKGSGGSGGGPGSGEEEWKNIHTMLNCILSMVEKTKRALGMLQNRAVAATVAPPSEHQMEPPWLRRPSTHAHPTNAAIAIESSEDLKRQVGEMMAQAFKVTEDRVSEVKRRAEEAVQEVKRQALAELKRAIAAAEAKACEAVASERARFERVLLDCRRNVGEPSSTPTPSVPPTPSHSDAEACWNCGRKAHETCSGCNTARYCSSFCQHKDWESHHNLCGATTSAPNSSQRTSSNPNSGQNVGGAGGGDKRRPNSSPINVTRNSASPEDSASSPRRPN